MFGFAFNPVVAAVVAGGLLVSHGAVAYKFYSFGADRQRVVCEQRVSFMKKQIEDANEAINRVVKARDEAIAKLEEEVAASAAKADEAQAAANVALGNYEDEITKRADKCLLTADDVNKLR